VLLDHHAGMARVRRTASLRHGWRYLWRRKHVVAVRSIWFTWLADLWSAIAQIIGEQMTYQEILDQICENRNNLVSGDRLIAVPELLRKFNEIEWALQALAEKLVEDNES
jgi:hypothetical protein